MLAKDIMTTEVITVSPEATLQEAAELMTSHNISGLPVVDGNLVLIGIISESDIIEDRALFSGLDHWINIESFLKRNLEKEHDAHEAPDQEFLSETVRDYMSTRLITAGPNSAVGEIGRLLVRNKINRIPIVKDRKIVGIITRGDILKAISQML